MKKYTVGPKEGNVLKINYQKFKELAKILPEKQQSFFTATHFLQFEKDDQGRIDIIPLMHSIVRRNFLNELKLKVKA